jgi:mannose-6-phosphate isomerase-like protein (cupin superfamily)
MLEQEYTKTWGEELWFANNEKYCGKLLTVRQNQWSSEGRFHYHKIKDETFFVVRGDLILDYVGDDNTFYRIKIPELGSFRVPPGMKHRFTASSDRCEFIEVSTTHAEEDSYRCSWNRRTEEWEEV